MRAILLILLLAVVSTSWAMHDEAGEHRICAPFRGGVVDPVIVESMLKAAQEGRLYRIRQKKSQVGFCVNSAIGRVEAEFEGVEGGMALSREIWGGESQVLVMVDADSLAMQTGFVRNMLMSEYFLDTYTYSRILFVSTGIQWFDRQSAVLDGMLTMHGRTRPVQFDVELKLVPDKDLKSITGLVVTARSYIDRTEFDMNSLRYIVSDEVELCMRIEAVLYRQ